MILFEYHAGVDLLRHLKFFTAVAETRHFGHAAQDLGMTQPPLSQGIQRLERHLGVRLFDRDAKGVHLTPAGHELLAPAREVQRVADDLVLLADHLSMPTQARIGLCSDLGVWITHICATVHAAGVDAIPTIAASIDLVDLVHAEQIDVAVIRHPGTVDGLDAGEIQLLRTQLRPAHVSARPLRELTTPFVVPPRHHQPPAHDQLIDALRRAGHSGAVIESADSLQREAMVSSGAAAALDVALPSDNTRDDLPPLRVRTVLPPERKRRPQIAHHDIADLIMRTWAT